MIAARRLWAINVALPIDLSARCAMLPWKRPALGAVMNHIALGAGALLLLSTSVANAGALDRTGQPIGILFEDGNYGELSFNYTVTDVQGTFVNPLTGDVAESGDASLDFGQVALSFKSDLTDKLSLAVILDHPFGADVDYGEADPTYPIAGSQAEFESLSVTALGRYEFNENFSVHVGARAVEVTANLLSQVAVVDPTTGAVGLYVYDGSFDSDHDLGYVVGAAYERPEIALRVALTYSSETEFSHVTTFSGTASGVGESEYTLPQSVNLDFQTGIAADTLLFGSVRWVDWSETEINAFGYAFNPVVSYEDDYVTYTLGLGRQLSDRIAASATVIYEPGIASDFDPLTGEGGASNLSPPDGQLGLQLAASYAVTDNVEVGAGLRYTRLGDSTTRFFGAEFEDNHAISAGLRVGVRF
jgi:long-chain fatty acid transport protein